MKIRSIKVNAILSMIKQVCAIIFPLITIPYVSRILEADNYGKINFSSSIISYFILIAGLGISSYAIREGARIRDEKTTFTKFSNEIFSINILATVLSYILLVVVVFISTKLQQYKLLLFIQSFAIILNTLGADWINSVYEDYLYLSFRYILIQIISLIALFLFVHTPNDYVIYAIIYVFSSSGGNLFNCFYIKKYTDLRFTFDINWKLHMKPIMILFFNAIASTIYVSSDTTILGYLRTENEVGIYGLAAKIYLSVKQILNAIILVSIPRLSSYLGNNQNGNYQLLSTKILDSLFTIVIPCSLGLFLLSDEIVMLVGGSSYSSGGVALQYLSCALIFAVIAGFYCCAVIIPFRLEKVCIFASSISALVNIILNFVLIPTMGFNGAALTTLLSEAIACIIYYFASKPIAHIRLTKRIFISTIVGSVGIMLICTILKTFIHTNYIYVMYCVVISGFQYFILQLLFENYIIKHIMLVIFNKIKAVVR